MRRPVHLSRKLVLEEVTRQPDNAGGFTESWSVLGVVWADVRAGAGRERMATAATISQVRYRILVRAAPVGAPSRPRPGQRFADGSRVYRVEAVADSDPDGLYLECFAKEEVST